MEPPTTDPKLNMINPQSMEHCRRMVSESLVHNARSTFGNLDPTPVMKGAKRVLYDPNRQRIFDKGIQEGYFSGDRVKLQGKCKYSMSKKINIVID